MKFFNRLSTALLMTALALQAGAATAGDDIRTPDNRVVYEVFVRNFSSSSKLSEVTRQLPRLKSLGVDVVWLMPIYKGGDKDRWGTYSSPYAVKDYKLIDPLYGTDADLKELVDAAHAEGMEIWLDWVANHTSTDAVWTKSNPEFYGSKFTKPMGWSDVYQLDYTNRNMCLAMIDALKYWVEKFDIDGYRCDYADGVPRDFWKEAREAVDEVKPITWLAESAGEGDNSLLVSETFDYNYAWAFNTSLISAGTSTVCADKVASAIYLLNHARDTDRYEGKSRLVYLSNHDVVQDQKGTPDRHFGANLNAMTVAMFTAYGMPLLYNGQEINWSTGQVLLAEKSVINWNKTDDAVTSLITSLTDLKHRCTVLNAGPTGGDFIRHSTATANSSVLVYERRKGNESVVVMLNFGSKVADFAVNTLPKGCYEEWFTKDDKDFAAENEFSLPARGYAVWVKTDDSEITPRFRKIFVDDQTGWSTLNIYAWADGNYAELFGGWPGASCDGTETLSDGVTYKVWSIPETLCGQKYHLIFNRSSSQLADYDYAFDHEIVLKVTSSGVTRKTVSAVDEITVAPTDEPEIYYNLQGIRVADPQPGQLYIMRKGTTAKRLIYK